MAQPVSVEYFEITLTGTGTTGTQALTKGQDPDQCWPFPGKSVGGAASWSNENLNRRLAQVEIFDNSGTPTVRVTRGAGATDYDITVGGFIVEMAAGVQKADATIAASSTSQDETITAVDPAKTLILYSYYTTQANDVVTHSSAAPTLEDSGGSTYDIARVSRDGTNDTCVGTIYVIEDLDDDLWDVQRVSISPASSTTGTAALSPFVDAAKSFCVGYMRSVFGNDDVNNNSVIPEIDSDGEGVTGTRAGSGGTPTMQLQVVELLAAGASVQRGGTTFADTDGVLAESITAIDQDLAVINLTSHGIWQCYTNSSSGEPESCCRAEFTADDEITLSRYTGSSTPPVGSDTRWEIIEFASEATGVAGTGTIAPNGPTVSGEADVTAAGTGTIAPNGPTVSGEADVLCTASGSVEPNGPVISATADVTCAGQGTVFPDSIAVTGEADVTTESVGSATLNLYHPSCTGSATVAVTGTGTLTPGQPTVTGSETPAVPPVPPDGLIYFDEWLYGDRRGL